MGAEQGYAGELGKLATKYRRLVNALDREREKLPIPLRHLYKNVNASAELEALRLQITARLPNGGASKKAADARRLAEAEPYRFSFERRQRLA